MEKLFIEATRIEVVTPEPKAKKVKVAPRETFRVGSVDYVVTDPDKRTVKKLTSLEDLSELLNTDLVIKNTFLGTMHEYLASKDPEHTTRRNDKVGNWIICRGYKITIDDVAGFAIYDMHDFGRHCEEFDNACPTPKEVWTFLNTKRVREKEVVTVKVTSKALPEKADKLYTDKSEEELSVEEYELFRNDLLKELAATKNIPAMAELVHKYIPNRKFNHRVNKLCNAFWQKEIRGSVFKTELLELVNTHSFTEPKKPGKKFVGLNWYLISTLEEVKDNVTFVTKLDGRFTMSKSEFLARYLLHIEPKIMPQMYRYLTEAITVEQFIEDPIVKEDRDAKYIDFDISILRNINPNLFIACTEILLEWEEPNPLNILYKNMAEVPIKVGDFVKVAWKDFHTKYSGQIIDFVNGVRIRYEDGAVVPLYKWQEFEITVPKKA